MTGRIVALHGGGHDATRDLLPWYVTDRLDAADTARVETHLVDCPECRADLADERRLARVLAALPVETTPGWAQLRARLTARPPRPAGKAWIGWAIAAQVLLVLAMATLPAPSASRAGYHALGVAPAVSVGNVLIAFQPGVSERNFRETLKASHARLVDGPTAADAYLLYVPGQERGTTLLSLRRSPWVAVAEPVDSGLRP